MLTAAQKCIVSDNLGLVYYICKRRYGSFDIEWDDLVSVGYMGLIRAALSYDEERGVGFGTYAAVCINNEIKMALRKSLSSPKPLSLDAAISNDDGDTCTLLNMLASASDDVSADIDDLSDKRELYRAIQMLPEKQRKLISLRFLYGWTQERVAKSMGYCQSYVCKMEQIALHDMWTYLHDKI